MASLVFVSGESRQGCLNSRGDGEIIYILEEALRKCVDMRAQQPKDGEDKYRDQFTLIFDLWGFNCSMNYKARSLRCRPALQLSLRIRRVLIVNTPWIFRHKIIEHFLPPDSVAHRFANGYEEMATYVAKEQLLSRPSSPNKMRRRRRRWKKRSDTLCYIWATLYTMLIAFATLHVDVKLFIVLFVSWSLYISCDWSRAHGH